MNGGKSFIEAAARKSVKDPQFEKFSLTDYIAPPTDKSDMVPNNQRINEVCGDDAECHADINRLLGNVQAELTKNFEKFKGYDDIKSIVPGHRKAGDKFEAITDGKLKNLLSDFYNASNGKSTSAVDIETKKNLQRGLRQHIATLSPASQLLMLQDMQNTLGSSLVLIDPHSRQLDVSLSNTFYGGGSEHHDLLGGNVKDGKLQYSFNDLYYFLSDHFANELNNTKKSPNNPFFAPFYYPTSDVSVDQVLAALIHESSYQKFLRLYDAYKHAKTAPEMYAEKIKHVYKVLTDKNNVVNPWYLTKYIEGQERPMEQYRNAEFMATLNKFTATHASEPKITIKKVKVDE